MTKMKAFTSDAGSRLKKLRTMAGATRKDLQNTFNVSSNTLQAWENNKNPLSSKVVNNLCQIFLNLGILCTEEWLLYGKGKPPSYIEGKFSIDDLSNNDHLIEEEKIMKEAMIFKSHYADSKVIIVSDEAMLPMYQTGDYVGGFLYRNDDILIANGQNSIIITSENEVFFRKLLYLSNEKTYLLSAINPFDKFTAPLIYRDNITAAAPVVWHRRRIP